MRIRHRSGYHYAQPVMSSYNEARITPLSTPQQLVLDSQLSVEPATTTLRYWDYWGTLVHAFDVHARHTELAVTAETVVETAVPEGPRPECTWEDLAGPRARQRWAELLEPTEFVPVDETVREAASALAAGRSPTATCDAIAEWVQGRLRYEPGTTSVSSTALDALSQGSGVCQDFAHLTLALLRSVGIPSRYVSGYLHPSRDADVGVPVEGQSHAWVEAWVGDWLPLDPTNGRPVVEGHVVVGRARDYGDVSPLKGVYNGGPATALAVEVELTRLA